MLNFFKNIWKFLTSETGQKTVSGVVSIVHELVQYAMPAVKEVDNARTKATVPKLIKELQVPKDVVSYSSKKKYSDAEWEGILVGIAKVIMLRELEQIAEDKDGISLAERKYEYADEIPDRILNAAINLAYTKYREDLDNF